MGRAELLAGRIGLDAHRLLAVHAGAADQAGPADRGLAALNKNRKASRLMDEKSAVTALAALVQGMRLRVFRALVGAGPQGLMPSALSATLDVPASTLAST